MSQGQLYRESLATTMHETRRTHWLVWVFMWSMLVGLVLGIYGMYCEALAESERRDVMYGGATYRASAESQSRGHRSQPTAGAR